MPLFKHLITCVLLTISINSVAASIDDPQAGNAFLSCIDRSTSPEERKALAIWVYTALSAHSDLDDLTLIEPALKSISEQKAAKIFARLLSNDCKAETITAAAEEDTIGVEDSLKIHKANYKILITYALKAVSENKKARQSVNQIVKHTHLQLLEEREAKQESN